MVKRRLLREFWEVQGRVTGLSIYATPSKKDAFWWKKLVGKPTDRIVRVRRYAVSTLKGK